MIGGNPYHCSKCPECGKLMWNGLCENKDCKYHYYPMNEKNNEGLYIDRFGIRRKNK